MIDLPLGHIMSLAQDVRRGLSATSYRKAIQFIASNCTLLAPAASDLLQQLRSYSNAELIASKEFIADELLRFEDLGRA